LEIGYARFDWCANLFDTFQFDTPESAPNNLKNATTMMKTVLFVVLIAILGFVLASEQRGRAPVRR
jgi:hypothetical protein